MQAQAQRNKEISFHLSKSRPGFLAIGVDQVYLFAVLVVFGIVVSLMPLFPNDFWWHLKIGEIIYNTGRIPATNLYGWSLPADAPFTYGAWLAEYLFYRVYRLGGISLISFIRTLLTLAAFTMIGLEAVRRSGSWRIAGLVTMLACAMASNNTVVRPQDWAWIPFAAFYIILSMYVDHRLKPAWLLLCPLIMAFWVNVHGSYILAVILCGIFFAGETVRKLLKLDGALSYLEIGWIAAAGAGVVTATLANPKFYNIFGYVLKLMTDQPSQTLVGEWQSPTPDSYATILFFIAVLVMLGIFAYSRYRPTPTEILLIFGFLWLAWTGLRYVVWFGMVSMPILGKAIYDLVKDKPWMGFAPRQMANTVFIAALLIPLVLVQPWLIERVPLPESYWNYVIRGSAAGPLLSNATPVEAAEYLRQHPGGKLYNEMGTGSYLIWANPDQKVFVDPRVELYPYNLWLDYLKINRGNHYNELLSKYGADRLLLNSKDQAELIKYLVQDPTWRREYSDANFQIWSRNP